MISSGGRAVLRAPHASQQAGLVDDHHIEGTGRAEKFSFEDSLHEKYPDLKVKGFLNQLKAHRWKVLQNPTRREMDGVDTLKRVMRAMPHSTALITALADGKIHFDNNLANHAKLSPYHAHFRGAVVSSMTSVTMGPPAIISFNFKEPSATLRGIRANRFFAIHFLKGDVHGANLASQFLRNPGDHHAAWRAVSESHFVHAQRKLVHHSKGKNLLQNPITPIISGPGVASRLFCEILPDKCVDGVGDHSIIVSKVVAGARDTPHSFVSADDSTNHQDRLRPLLMYSNGQFRAHGSILDPQRAPALAETSIDSTPDPIKAMHPDTCLSSDIINAADPVLYQAATSYIENALLQMSRLSLYQHFVRLYEDTSRSTDRRAKFLFALKCWQAEQALLKAKGSEMEQSLGQAHSEVTDLLQDAPMVEVAQALVRECLDAPEDVQRNV